MSLDRTIAEPQIEADSAGDRVAGSLAGGHVDLAPHHPPALLSASDLAGIDPGGEAKHPAATGDRRLEPIEC